MNLLYKPTKHTIKFFILALILAICSSIVISNIWVYRLGKNKTFTTIQEIPRNKVGLLLGTSKFRVKGVQNIYYQNRIQAACQLYFANKIDYILVSGDNGIIEYNEPKTMKQDLIASGIPENRIILDYAGFRTLDSVVRAHKVFGQTKFTIISQAFHNERAIFIARYNKLNAIGFNANDVGTSYGFKTRIRELFARVKVVLDLFILQKEPKFLGEQIAIPSQKKSE